MSAKSATIFLMPIRLIFQTILYTMKGNLALIFAKCHSGGLIVLGRDGVSNRETIKKNSITIAFLESQLDYLP